MVRHEPGELMTLVALKGNYWRAAAWDTKTWRLARDGFDRDTVRREAYRAAMLLAAIRGEGTMSVFHPPGFAK